VTKTEPATPVGSRSFVAGLPGPLVGRGRASIAYWWILSRALTISLLVLPHENEVAGDVRYYGLGLNQLFHGGTLAMTFQEYPLPVFLLVTPQYLLGFMNRTAFEVLFVLSMMGVDAAFTAALWRGDGRRRGDATSLWLWFVPMLGPLAYFRFDLVPAVLAGGAVLVALRRPGLAGALTAAGAALKLWPAVMLPTFLIRRRDRRPVLAGFLSTGVLAAVGAAAIGGGARTLSPLQWQSARGLQLESVYASPLMLARMVRPHGGWQLRVSRFKAWEIFGPGVSVLLMLATVATLLGGATLVLMWWRALHAVRISAESLGWLFLSTALVVTITNKTLSPQYLLWLGGPIAALAVRAPDDWAVRSFGQVLMLATLATQLVFPLGYNGLVTRHSMMPVVTLILVTRNVLLVWLTYYAVRQFWLRSRPS
jgi:hypothetical protein